MTTEADRQTEEILHWIHGGKLGTWFKGTTIDQELGYKLPRQKANRRQILKRFADKQIVERDPKIDGRYRYIDSASPILDWQTANPENIVPIRFPFKLEEYVSIYPKNIIVVAGSPNAGKTAFLLNMVALNQDSFQIFYYTSEMGAEEMKLRLSKFNTDFPPDFARERSTNFADVIHPDALNIIDYLEVTTDFFLVAQEIMAIWDKLKSGIAVIAIQKKKGAQFDMGRGGEFSMEKPRLYLAMDSGRLKIVKAKNWAQHDLNPNGLAWTFQLVNGAKFVNIIEATDA